MKAIILAAGRGSRMKLLTQNTPKCLLKIKERPLLEWQIDALRGSQIDQIGIATGYLKEQLSKFSLIEFHNKNWAKTQMVASLFCAKEWLSNSDFIISYSDIFYDTSAIQILKNCHHDISITFDPNWRSLWEKRFEDPLIDAESFKLDSKNRIIEIGNRAKKIEEIEGQYMGLIKTSKKGWLHLVDLYESLNNNQKDNLDMTSLLKMVLKEKKFSIYAHPYNGLWGEVDYERDLESYK